MRRGSSDGNGVSLNWPERRPWVGFFKVLAVLLLVVAAAVAATITVARASLPGTCAVSEHQFDKLSMQMSYDAVKQSLGCDGMLVSKEDYGQIIIAHFTWRGAAWPYGRLRLEFINNTLHGTQKLWLNVSVSMSK